MLLATLAFAQEPPPPPALPAVIPERGTVKVLVRGMAIFPAEARAQGIAAGGCKVVIYFDESGSPLRAVPVDCDEVWVAESTRAAMEFRIEPYVLDGVRRKVRWETAFVFAIETPPDLVRPPPAQQPPPPTP